MTIVYVGLGVYDYNELHSMTITIVFAIGVDMQNGSWLTGSVYRGRDGVCMYGGFMLCYVLVAVIHYSTHMASMICMASQPRSVS